MYKGRLNYLGLLRGSRSSHCRRRIAIGRSVASVAVCGLRLHLVQRRGVALSARAVEGWRPHGRCRGRGDVHGIAWWCQRRAGRGENGDGSVQVWVVLVGGERASTGFCDRGHDESESRERVQSAVVVGQLGQVGHSHNQTSCTARARGEKSEQPMGPLENGLEKAGEDLSRQKTSRRG